MYILDENSAKNLTRVNTATKAIRAGKKTKTKKIKNERNDAIKAFRDRCIEYADGLVKDENGNIIKYKTGTKCGNIVGDRIRVMLNEAGMNITELAKKSGVGRSSLQRFLADEDPDVPTVSTLNKIIDAFPYPYDDFLFSADDFEEWKHGLVYGYAIPWSEDFLDYEQFMATVVSCFGQSFIYGDGMKKYRMPDHIVDFLCKHITLAFDATNALLEYEKMMDSPKAYYRHPVEAAEL